MLTRIGKVTVLAAVGVFATAGPAFGHGNDAAIDNAQAADVHEAQHDGTDGHLLPVDENVELVGKLELSNVEPGGIADVAVFGDHAYLAAFGRSACENTGVHVVDISDVGEPQEVGFIRAPEGSFPGEGVQVVSIDTPDFTGDVLLTNNEICDPATGFGGINLYDVTDPLQPQPLAVGFGDADDVNDPQRSAHQTHSVFAWDAGDDAYAVMVDNQETADVDIVDITDPRTPVLVAEHDLAALFPEILQPEQGLDQVNLHDMVVKEIDGRFVMLASYWDAGYVQLDVTDPANPVRLSDSDFANPDPEALESGFTVAPEGNAHQAEFTSDDAFVIGADEDFNAYAVTARNDTDGTELDAAPGSSEGTQLDPGETISGQAVFVGRACPGDPAVPAGGDGTQIAVTERGVCDFTAKVAAVEAAGGYEAILVFNREGPDGCNIPAGMLVEGNTPTFGVAPREQGLGIFNAPYDDAACLAGDGSAVAPITVGTAGDTLTFSSYFDGWGYVRLFDATDMTEMDTYAIPEAHDPRFARAFGDLSVHEVAVSLATPGLAYLSYYSGGLRVIDISTGEIQEVGAFIDEGGNNFWGVETFVQDEVEYAALSDRDFGLYIFRYTPES